MRPFFMALRRRAVSRARAKRGVTHHYDRMAFVIGFVAYEHRRADVGIVLTHLAADPADDFSLLVCREQSASTHRTILLAIVAVPIRRERTCRHGASRRLNQGPGDESALPLFERMRSAAWVSDPDDVLFRDRLQHFPSAVETGAQQEAVTGLQRVCLAAILGDDAHA